MPADTFSSTLGWLVMGTGNDNNNWGDIANASVFAVLEKAIAGINSRTVGSGGVPASGTLDLSGSPPPAGPSGAIEQILSFTGVLTGALAVVVPNLPKTWLVRNTCTGGFALSFKTPSAGLAGQVPAGTWRRLVCDGSNNIIREDIAEVGEIRDFAGASVPAGYLECDGSTPLIANYPDLAAILGTTWGGNGTTTFGLPNLKDFGRFRRSRTGSIAIGTYQSSDNLSHSHATSLSGSVDATNLQHNHALTALKGETTGAAVIGSNGASAQRHTHNIKYGFSGFSAGANTAVVVIGAGIQNGSTDNDSPDHDHYLDWSGKGTDNALGNHSHGISGIAVTNPTSGGGESRPYSAVVMTCIRY